MDPIETRAVWPLLEIRQSGRTITGVFNFRATATISDRGTTRKETIAPGAFDYAIDSSEHEIHLLHGHSFDRPLASKRGGTLALATTAAALTFTATLPEETDQPSYMVDAVKQLRAGLIGGISPGFRVPPRDVVPNAEELVPEEGNPDVMIRQINAAVLYELSLVSRPAYDQTEVDVRSKIDHGTNRDMVAKPYPGLRALRWL